MVREGGASEGAACFPDADDDRDWRVRLVVSPEWRLLDFLRSVFERLALKESKAFHCVTDQSLQEIHVESLVQFLPLHLVHVGCGSLTTDAMCAPHLRPSTPGQSLSSQDDMTQTKLAKEEQKC